MVVVPHADDGRRSEPPVSDPVAAGVIRAASAAALPPLDPPGLLVVSHGLPVCGVPVLKANSLICVCPSNGMPAALSRAHTVLSPAAMLTGKMPDEPSKVLLDAVSGRPLTA